MPMLECTNEVWEQQMPKAKNVHTTDVTHDMWMTQPELLSQYIREYISGNKNDVFIEN